MVVEVQGGSIDPATVARLKAERDRFVALAFCWADILMELDKDGKIVFVGGTTLPILGKSSKDITGLHIDSIVADVDRHMIRHLLKITEQFGRIDGVQVRFHGIHGPTPPMALAGYRLDDLSNHFFMAARMGASADAGVARDGETGLIDGDAFAEVAAHRMKKRQAAGEDVKMTVVSMEDLSNLRERLDEASEQSLMKTVGASLRAHSVDGDAAARIGPESYSLVHDASLDISDFEREIETMSRDADPTGEGVSIQTATVDVDDAEISEEDLAKSLIYVVNRFQEAEGGAFTIKSLTTNLSSLMSEAAASVEGFKKVVADGAFDLAFQPIIGSRDGQIHHYEALTRFHSGGKNESPYRYITFAEETGLIGEFDLAVAGKAVEWLGKWPRNTSRYKIAVNISGHSVGNEAYVSSLHKLLRDNPWVEDKLMFEITESSRMADLDAANVFIQGLRKSGHHVCLDDFGAGSASFQYMSALEVDVVKLDGSAIRNAQSGPKGRAFLTAMASLCKSLAVETIAEMIDKEEGLIFVRDCGVNYVQGFLFGQPSPNIKDFDPLPMGDVFRRRRL
ncbi:MAG: EAL domain-containing protein [Rhodospirillales bacterium]|nr:EAL domain-containing protein [Rhodospirillales bacterium]